MLLLYIYIAKGNDFLPLLCEQIDRLKLVISLITKKIIHFLIASWESCELDSFIAVKSGWALDP